MAFRLSEKYTLTVPFVASARTAVGATLSACVPLTLWPVSPLAGRPLRVSTAACEPSALVTVVPPTRNTTVSSVAEAVCTHTPSASVSPAVTAYSNRSTAPFTLARLSTLRLLARLPSSAPRSRRTRTLPTAPVTVTGSLNVTSTRIFSPCP